MEQHGARSTIIRNVGMIALLALTLQGCGGSRPPEAGFWFDESSWTLDAVATDKLGGPVTEQEWMIVKAESTSVLKGAFAGFPLTISASRDAFWRLRVRLTTPGRHKVPVAGETRALGRFGASSDINFDVLALAAITYAPEGASRDTILRGIGRGIGRTAAHELAHAILGPSAVMDQATDEDSFEFHSFARPAHFYGEPHWTAARPALLLRLSR